MNRITQTAAVAFASLPLLLVPTLADAQSRAARQRAASCEQIRRAEANRGAVVGAVAGGVLGNVVAAKGVKTEGTVLGAGVGAVAGNQLASRNARARCVGYRR